MNKNKNYCQKVFHNVSTRTVSDNKFTVPIKRLKLSQQHISFVKPKIFHELQCDIRHKNWEIYNKLIETWTINTCMWITKIALMK